MTKEQLPKSRKVIVQQPPTKEVEYWGRDKYVNHTLDGIFILAETDDSRPSAAHIGWWAVKMALSGTNLGDEDRVWEPGCVLMDLPFRYEGELDPITNLYSLFSEMQPDSDQVEGFYYAFLLRVKRKFDQFELYTPEDNVNKAVWDFYSKSLEAFSKIRQ